MRRVSPDLLDSESDQSFDQDQGETENEDEGIPVSERRAMKQQASLGEVRQKPAEHSDAESDDSVDEVDHRVEGDKLIIRHHLGQKAERQEVDQRHKGVREEPEAKEPGEVEGSGKNRPKGEKPQGEERRNNNQRLGAEAVGKSLRHP